MPKSQKLRAKSLFMTQNPHVLKFVEEMVQLASPEQVVWCDGSEEERKRLIQLSLEEGSLDELNQEKLPNCYLRRTPAHDVARTENLTFICTDNKETVGPTNNWMVPNEAYQKIKKIYQNSMKGRTLYVVPFIMGPPNSKYSRVGVQVTDSIYVVLNMRIMTRMGKIAYEQLGDSDNFTKCIHGKIDLSIDNRMICHFPQDNVIWSVGSGYGGNALLGKKCLALRIASSLGKNEGWMAEHMLILGIEDPEGNVSYVAAAFPSACGKTNLAMLVPPESQKGYKIWTVGDDIAWLNIGDDGKLYAINPEAGFFGVVPGTSYKTNPNAMETIKKNTIFTNVLKTRDGDVWWEGKDDQTPEGINWLGNSWNVRSTEKAAHPNSRFTAPASQCPSISPEWENPQGVPISAIIFGGRRAKVAPLVYESFDWQQGTYVGSTIASETTAAQTGEVGVVRRDPMAMLPFCGYNIGDYFQHWLDMGKKIKNPPKIFYVNWFRTDSDGNYLWPGFGENIRVLRWIIDRVNEKADARETPLGYLPKEIDIEGLDINQRQMYDLLNIDPEEWKAEAESREIFLSSLGDAVPQELFDENNQLKERLKK